MRLSTAAMLCALLASTAMHAGGQASTGVARAAHDLARGAVLAAGDIDAPPAQEAQARQLVGWVTRRIIHQGEALKAPAVAPAPLVQAGESVTIEAGAGAVTATRTGLAIGGGALGEHVRIRVDTYRIITAIVTGPATVRLPSAGDHR